METAAVLHLDTKIKKISLFSNKLSSLVKKKKVLLELLLLAWAILAASLNRGMSICGEFTLTCSYFKPNRRRRKPFTSSPPKSLSEFKRLAKTKEDLKPMKSTFKLKT